MFPSSDLVVILKHQGAGFHPRLERSRVGPAAFADVEHELATLDVGIVHRGDLELPARGTPNRANDIPDLVVVEVEANDREFGLGILWLFFDFEYLPLVHGRNAVSLRLTDFFHDDTRTRLLAVEIIGIRSDRVLEDVVAKHDANLVFTGERLSQAQCIRDACGFLLYLVSEGASEFGAAAQAIDHIAHVLCTGDYENVFNARRAHVPDRM